MYNELSTLGDTLDKRYAANERQRLADLQAGQARSDNANQRRILTEAPPVNWDIPEGYQFGVQNAQVPAPQQAGIQTSGGGAYKSRAGVGRPTTVPASYPDQTTNETARLARYKTDGDKMGELRRIQLLGDPTPQQRRELAYTPRGVAANPMTADARLAKLTALNPDTSGRSAAGSAPLASTTSPTPGYANESAMRAAATGDIGAATGAIDREIAALQADYSKVTDPRDKAALGEELQRLQAQRTKYAGSTYTPGNQQQAAPSQTPQQASAPTQPQSPTATYSGMGPAGTPQMLQEQIQLAQFRYNQLAQMLPHSPPEQQAKIHAELGVLQAGVRAQQAYMLASQADVNPRALRMLVTGLAGAQAARTKEGMYVFVDTDGNAVSQPMTGGQMGAYVYRAMDANARAAQAKVQEQIALERAKGAIKTEGELAVEGVKGNNQMQLARLQGINSQSAILAQAQAKGAHVTTSPSGDAFIVQGDKIYRVGMDGNVTAVNLQPGANPGMTADFMAQ